MDGYVNFAMLTDSGPFKNFIEFAYKTGFKNLLPTDKIMVTPYTRSRFVEIRAVSANVPKAFLNGEVAYDAKGVLRFYDSLNIIEVFNFFKILIFF